MRKSLINLPIVTPVPLFMQSFLPSIPQPVHSRNINEASEKLASEICAQFGNSRSLKSESKGIKVIKNVIDVVQPIIENKMGITFKSHLSDNFSIRGIVSSSQNRKSVVNTVKN